MPREQTQHDGGEALERLRLLQRARTTREPSRPMAAMFETAAAELERSRRRLGRVGEAWERVCPATHLDRTAIVGLSKGTLTVRVGDDATRFEIDRAMRDGGERELIRLCPAGVSRVRLVSGPVAARGSDA